ncbi:helix-turn-helix transcriptional regulator [Cytophagaceae bacterium YF14B1]|uniref:Helix-turn-helix transcriptional regulator n=1 Tax=Xanthocytophaga flava TaxID=3048013 RepID=A0AAE3QVU5_9BACT|nr:helix-turn-helix transcriptional regulator [Xanthocytophaga flavus]MDJ1485931.1 helix-turn-helix transcriptional regulator [Xanthocytophaga flavus]
MPNRFTTKLKCLFSCMDGQQLKLWRLNHNLTQSQLASLLGVGKRGYVTVTEWENGVSKMGRLYKMQLEKLLGLTTEQLHALLEENS